jgi:hypothetical protein
MVRHIDAERFEKDITGKAKIINGKTYFECDFVYETLWKQPTADVAEMKHGKWKIKRDEYDCEYMVCSCCKEEFYPVDEDTVGTTPNYCSNCGAKMNKGE